MKNRDKGSWFKEEITNQNLQPSLLPQDSLASLSVLPGSEEARKMTATSGLRHSQLLKKSDPSGYCLKMLLESSTWRSTLCYLTWKVRATPGKRLLFQLVPSMPGIDETEFGLWPTPNLMDAIANPPKGKEETYENLHALKLAHAVKMWPTPRGSDNQGGVCQIIEGTNQRISKTGIKAGVKLSNIYGSGQLNPNWVEWLMGFPIGWTGLNASGMP